MDQQPLMGVNMSELLASPQLQATLQGIGMDRPEAMELGITMALDFLYGAIPDPPVSPDAPLVSAGATWSATNDGVDRIGLLPDQILQNIISRLPAKSAVRTGALAARWRGLWRSVPLVLVDAHILPDFVEAERMAPGGDDISSLFVVAAASRALATHPGPFRCVHLTWSNMAAHRAEIARWLRILAAKGVQELAFINRPWPLDLPLPSTVFSCSSLTRLHLGVWKFPDTAALPRAAGFPHLQELVLSLFTMQDRDLAFMLDRSPVLEFLTVIASLTEVRLRLVSGSLRCVQLGMSSLAEVAVVDAPRLERLLLWMARGPRSRSRKYSRISVGNAPKLRVLGHWQPEIHELEISNIVIQAGTRVKPSTTVRSVQILALEVQFGVRNEVKMVPSFLKCFPNVETLHVYSVNADQPTGTKLNLKFWQESGHIECVQSHVKKIVFQEFRGIKNELVFLKFIAERAQKLEKMVIMVSSECFPTSDHANALLKPLTSAKWGSEDCKLIVFKSPVDDSGTPAWNFGMASDFSFSDPFDLLTDDAELSGGGATELHHPSTL